MMNLRFEFSEKVFLGCVVLIAIAVFSACSSFNPHIVKNGEKEFTYRHSTASDYDEWLTAFLFNDFLSAQALAADSCQLRLAQIFAAVQSKKDSLALSSIIDCLRTCRDSLSQNMSKYLLLIYSTLHSNTYIRFSQELDSKILDQEPQTISIQKDSVEFDIEFSDGRICIFCDIEGQTYKFWLDTGAPTSVITTKALESISGEKYQRFLLESFGFNMATIKRVNFSEGFFVGNHCFHVNDDPNFSECSGLIGWNIFSRIPFKLDLVNKKIIVYRNPRNITAQKNFFGIEHPYITFRYEDGTPFNLVLDTGCPTSFLHKSAIQKYVPSVISSDTASFTWINNDTRKEDYLIAKDLRLDSYTFSIIFDKYRIVNNSRFNFFYDGMLGTNILEGNAFYIDFPNGHFVIE